MSRPQDGPERLQDLSSNAGHQVARFYAAAEATIHGYRAKIDGPHTLIKVNDKLAQVLGRRRNGAWQVDKDPPFDENAEVVIFVDLGCVPPGFFIAPARETSDGIRARLDKARHGGQRPRNPAATTARSSLEHIRQWQDHWNAFS
jgi:hypothetical protein